MNGVAVEQVEETKLLGVTLDCKLSWSEHIDSMVVKMGRGLSAIKRCSAFLTPHSIKQVTQGLVLSYFDYCPVMWSSAAKKDLGKLQLAQNRAACLVLHCNQRDNIMHVTPIVYSANKQQTWFKKTNKGTPHGTTPLPHVTYLLCVCNDMYCICN